jgi:hypothetical protein
MPAKRLSLTCDPGPDEPSPDTRRLSGTYFRKRRLTGGIEHGRDAVIESATILLVARYTTKCLTTRITGNKRSRY